MIRRAPTLTHDSQGLGEFIINEYSGWFAKNDAEIVNKAINIWKDCQQELFKLSGQFCVFNRKSATQNSFIDCFNLLGNIIP